MGASPSSTVVSRPDAFALAADLLDPPAWEPKDRAPLEPHQVPPEGDWSLWLLQAGRGAGKTEACARYFAAYMRANPGHRGRIIAPTYGDAVEACIRGPSGLRSIDPEVRWLPSDPGGSKVYWPNRSEALVFGTPHPQDVERFRAGGNRHLDWWEEMAANPMLGTQEDEQGAWNQAQLGLRLGKNPHSIGSTTPRTSQAYRQIAELPRTVITRASLFDNPHNPQAWVEQTRARYEGTRLGRQELLGELIEDVEGAIWQRAWIDRGRVSMGPTGWQRKVLSLDPSDGKSSSDEQAWCLAGIGDDHRIYVIDSEGMRTTPTQWLTAAIQLAHSVGATIVVEKNHGGAFLLDLLEQVMRQIGIRVAVVPVTASDGKRTRAEPVSMLYEQGANLDDPVISHIGEHPELEDQMCSWTARPGEASPDRMDALVWAVTELSADSGRVKKKVKLK